MILLPTAYLGNLQYYSKLLSGEACIDLHEHYLKQSYRNRCDILSAGGVMSLTVPVYHTGGVGTPTREIRIDYSKRWQHRHWQAIVSAYRGSPYFAHYEERPALPAAVRPADRTQRHAAANRPAPARPFGRGGRPDRLYRPLRLPLRTIRSAGTGAYARTPLPAHGAGDTNRRPAPPGHGTPCRKPDRHRICNIRHTLQSRARPLRRLPPVALAQTPIEPSRPDLRRTAVLPGFFRPPAVCREPFGNRPVVLRGPGRRGHPPGRPSEITGLTLPATYFPGTTPNSRPYVLPVNHRDNRTGNTTAFPKQVRAPAPRYGFPCL